MKYFLFVFILFAACSENTASKQPAATTALDAGRGYLEACLQGDFSQAASYLGSDSLLQQNLRIQEADYRSLEREGRQMRRTASIQIHAINEVTADKVLMIYSFSYSPEKKDTLHIQQQPTGWMLVTQF
ncbi:MAG: hypothetical protein FGM61_13175 [Sediminibacterium sp.]|nr:hypothetical protein [Sediminibacterium sp.]